MGVLEQQAERHPSEWSKLERIRYLLDHWSDIFDPKVTSPLGSPGDGSGVSLMPKMAHHSSVLELSRCLALLGSEYPSLNMHLKAYRCGVEWRQRRAMIRVKLPSGRWDAIPGWKRERIVPRWVREDYVSAAEAYLVREFSGEVFIPKDLWDGLTKPIQAA